MIVLAYYSTLAVHENMRILLYHIEVAGHCVFALIAFSRLFSSTSWLIAQPLLRVFQLFRWHGRIFIFMIRHVKCFIYCRMFSVVQESYYYYAYFAYRGGLGVD